MKEITEAAASPFESIKHTDDQGDYWLAREMWEPAGYATWQNFEPLIQRAISVCEDKFPGQGFIMVNHNNSVPRGPGRPQGNDYRCEKYGAYMILSRSDKPELADYFVMQTMYAENAQRQAAVAGPERGSMAWYREASQELGATDFFASGAIKHLDPDRMLSAAGEYRLARSELHGLVSEGRALLLQAQYERIQGAQLWTEHQDRGEKNLHDIGFALEKRLREVQQALSPAPVAPSQGDDFEDPFPDDKGRSY